MLLEAGAHGLDGCCEPLGVGIGVPDGVHLGADLSRLHPVDHEPQVTQGAEGRTKDPVVDEQAEKDAQPSEQGDEPGFFFDCQVARNQGSAHRADDNHERVPEQDAVEDRQSEETLAQAKDGRQAGSHLNYV